MVFRNTDSTARAVFNHGGRSHADRLERQGSGNGARCSAEQGQPGPHAGLDQDRTADAGRSSPDASNADGCDGGPSLSHGVSNAALFAAFAVIGSILLAIAVVAIDSLWR
jgi:hypothetical protein